MPDCLINETYNLWPLRWKWLRYLSAFLLMKTILASPQEKCPASFLFTVPPSLEPTGCMYDGVSDELMRRYDYKKTNFWGPGTGTWSVKTWSVVRYLGSWAGLNLVRGIYSVGEAERSFIEESGLWWPHTPNRWPILTFTANVTILLEDQNSICYTFPPAKMSALPETALQCPADILHD